MLLNFGDRTRTGVSNMVWPWPSAHYHSRQDDTTTQTSYAILTEWTRWHFRAAAVGVWSSLSTDVGRIFVNEGFAILRLRSAINMLLARREMRHWDRHLPQGQGAQVKQSIAILNFCHCNKHRRAPKIIGFEALWKLMTHHKISKNTAYKDLIKANFRRFTH